MNRKQRIKNILSKNFKDFSIEIIDNSVIHAGHHNFTGNEETHIKIVLKNKNFNNYNRLDIHRSINSLLAKEFDSGLHSLEIKIN